MEQKEKDHAADAGLKTPRTPSRGSPRLGWEGWSPRVPLRLKLLRVDLMGDAPGHTAGGSAFAAVVIRISIPAALVAASRRLRRRLVGDAEEAVGRRVGETAKVRTSSRGRMPARPNRRSSSHGHATGTSSSRAAPLCYAQHADALTAVGYPSAATPSGPIVANGCEIRPGLRGWGRRVESEGPQRHGELEFHRLGKLSRL